ncbi:hypothetical protein AB0D97_14085 [Streptomyces roseus]|uniref:hypothetical protein n=1 Tax=Streptomyces roseus TaxID=66430 RepID=UPI0033D41D29
MPTSPGALVDALTSVWTRIRADLPELPGAKIALVTTPPPADHGPERWSLTPDGTLQGLAVSTDVLIAGPEDVVTALLHDAAHVLCWRRGIKDTATRGYYHNDAYLKAAQECGLEWPDSRERDRVKGYPDPRMTDETRRRHIPDMEELARVLPEVLPHLEVPRPTSKRTGRPAFQCGGCTPARRIWAAQSTADLGPIVCGVCGKPFT